MNGFGLARDKPEGKAVHPDETEAEMGDEFYLRQLQAYADWRGVEETKAEICDRPHLLEKLK